jgi:secernin
MCDCLVVLGHRSTTGATLFAKNSDRPPDEQQIIELTPPRHDVGQTRCTTINVRPHKGETINALISRPIWGWGAEHGVNAAGVAIGNERIYTTLDPRSAIVGLTGMDLVRLALERAPSATEAVTVITDMIERYGQGGSGLDPTVHPVTPYWSSFLVADPTHALVIETSGRTVAVHHISDVWAISNRTTIAAFDREHRHPRQPVEITVDPRLHRSHRVLARERLALTDLGEWQRSHDGPDGWTVCMHRPDMATTASLIAELDASSPPRVWMATGHPCRRPLDLGEALTIS